MKPTNVCADIICYISHPGVHCSREFACQSSRYCELRGRYLRLGLKLECVKYRKTACEVVLESCKFISAYSVKECSIWLPCTTANEWTETTAGFDDVLAESE